MKKERDGGGKKNDHNYMISYTLLDYIQFNKYLNDIFKKVVFLLKLTFFLLEEMKILVRVV